jgi:molecular chaperone GrpE
MSEREEEQPMSEETQPAPEMYTPEAEIDQLRQQLESKEQDIKNQQDKYLRMYAEFENYKKRAARDQEEFSKYANERLLKELLPVVDNLERAIVHTKDTKEPEKILEGLELILKQFLEAIGKFGVTGFESILQPFDPTKHQAIGQTESEEHEEGTVIEEIERGYRLNDRILRPALVIVSKRKNKGDKDNAPQDTGDE